MEFIEYFAGNGAFPLLFFKCSSWNVYGNTYYIECLNLVCEVIIQLTYKLDQVNFYLLINTDLLQFWTTKEAKPT